MNIDELIDRFVKRINELPREPVWHDDVPESVQKDQTDKDELFRDWNIKTYDASAWIDELEKKLPAPFPQAFRSLVTRYIFPRFVVGDVHLGDVHLLANTPEGIEELYELRTGIFADEYMSPFLLDRGFIQFARPEGDYDAICFDMNSQTSGEPRIVRIDHEGILCKDRIYKPQILASSFHELISNYLDSP